MVPKGSLLFAVVYHEVFPIDNWGAGGYNSV